MNINVGLGKLRFGSIGVQLTSQLRLNSRKIFRIKLFLKKSVKRSEDTRRKVYLNIFPHLPLTKKVLGSRMGKGKGKLSLWFTELNMGHILLEFLNLRRGRSRYFIKQIQNKIKSKVKVIYFYENRLILKNSNFKKNIEFQTFW